MKILHVITSLYTGGAEKLIVDLLPRFREMGNEVELLLFDGTETPFYHELSNVGITIHHLSIGGNVYNPLNILRLKKFLKQYDIIHTHNTACQYYIALAKSLSHSVCHLVTTEHNTTNRRRGIPFFKHIDRFIYNQYERIIAIAPSTADNLKNFVVTCPKIEVIYNGIDISKYNTNPPAAITTEM